MPGDTPLGVLPLPHRSPFPPPPDEAALCSRIESLLWATRHSEQYCPPPEVQGSVACLPRSLSEAESTLWRTQIIGSLSEVPPARLPLRVTRGRHTTPTHPSMGGGGSQCCMPTSGHDDSSPVLREGASRHCNPLQIGAGGWTSSPAPLKLSAQDI